jgi:hypothetical protein
MELEKNSSSKEVVPAPVRSKTRHKIAEKASKLAKSSSSHGLPNIVRANNYFIKFMWLFFFLLALITCTRYMMRTLNDYFSYKVVTQIRHFSEIPALFPTVSICNENPFLTYESGEFVRKTLSQNFIDPETLESKFLKNNTDFMNAYFSKYLVGQNVFGKNLSNREKLSFGYPIQDQIMSCIFKGQICDPNDFEWVYNLQHGNCLIFNGGFNSKGEKVPLKYVTQTGKYVSLHLEMFVRLNESYESISLLNGAHIFIHNHTERMRMHEGIHVPVGFQTNIVVDRLFVQKIESPYSECVSNENKLKHTKFYEIILKSRQKYRIKDCILLCLQEHLIEKCKCYDVQFDRLNISHKPCTTIAEINCSLETYRNYFSSRHYNECSTNECHAECDNEFLSFTTSLATFPTRRYSDKLIRTHSSLFSRYGLEKASYELIKDSILAVDIHYEYLGYKLINEIPHVTVESLISQLGGMMGLFIGIFLKFILDFFFKVI